MALIFMPRKSGFIYMLILGLICFVGGILKREIPAILVGAIVSLYAVISLATGKKKDKKTIVSNNKNKQQ